MRFFMDVPNIRNINLFTPYEGFIDAFACGVLNPPITCVFSIFFGLLNIAFTLAQLALNLLLLLLSLPCLIIPFFFLNQLVSVFDNIKDIILIPLIITFNISVSLICPFTRLLGTMFSSNASQAKPFFRESNQNQNQK
ncbi:MAG: hypothetical protein QNK11_05790, partial [Legionella sp.]|nr:hypothetical protein [Legionella sp.]